MIKRKTKPGWISTDLIVSMILLWMLLTLLAVSLNATGKYNRLQLVRGQCLAAAESQMSSVTATGEVISDEDISRLWENVKVAVEKTDGKGQWQGLQQIKVTASRMLKKRQVKVELKKYVYIGQD